MRIKKIVAREFLTALACLIITFLFFVGMLAYNSLLDHKRSSNLNRIEKIPRLVDSLSILQPYKTKRVNQEWLYNRLEELGANSKYVNSDEAWARLIYLNNTDSIAIKWDNKWKKEFVVVLKRIGFQSASSFSFFIEQNTFSENEYNTHKSIIEMEKEIEKLNQQVKGYRHRIIYDADLKIYSINLLLAIATIGFPLRYLIYATLWSYRVLKQE